MKRAKYLQYTKQQQPEEISSVIGAVLEGATVDVDLRHGEIIEQWPSLAPGDWRFGTPVGVRDNTLLVTVPDGATASLLRYQMTPLLNEIATRFGSDVVTAVRLTVEGRPSAAIPSE